MCSLNLSDIIQLKAEIYKDWIKKEKTVKGKKKLKKELINELLRDVFLIKLTSL